MSTSPNPIYPSLLQSEVTVTSSRGPYSFICTETRRGAGEQKSALEISGLGPEPDVSDKDFLFEFGGKEYKATLVVVSRFDNSCRVRVTTVVDDRAFWKTW